MSEHTPGPWKVQPGFLTVFTCSEGTTGLTIALAKVFDAQLIADQDTVEGKQQAREQAEANAKLIAQAWTIPELLAALKYARRFLNAEDHDIEFVDAALKLGQDNG